MTEPIEEMTDLISSLIQNCVEGHEKFYAAAQAVGDPRLSRELSSFGHQRKLFALELKMKLLSCGEVPPEDRNSGSSLHGDRLDDLFDIEPTNGHAVLAACERSSRSAVDTYRRALGEVPPHYNDIIESQYEAIQDAHHRIKVLRSAVIGNDVQ